MLIEAEIIDYLIERNIVGSYVYAERPKDLPAEYILIQKTGSGFRNNINQAMVAIQSISSTSLLNAMLINEQVKEALLEMPDEREVYSVKLNSDYNFTNTNTKEYRYQAVFNFYY